MAKSQVKPVRAWCILQKQERNGHQWLVTDDIDYMPMLFRKRASASYYIRDNFSRPRRCRPVRVTITVEE